MLITFSCPACANITMFGDVALRLIRMMGHSGTVPSALLAKDVPAALLRLKAAIEVAKELPELQTSKKDKDKAEEESVVSLSNRALPLINLLNAAVKNKCNVMWESNS